MRPRLTFRQRRGALRYRRGVDCSRNGGLIALRSKTFRCRNGIDRCFGLRRLDRRRRRHRLHACAVGRRASDEFSAITGWTCGRARLRRGLEAMRICLYGSDVRTPR
ncbi:hypothetical protein ACFROC_25115, partial [Nocardia tengchongensis]|uniref:hypothetical protein n=1 Tax=Nocardia tengchongensis TaxID=2055889 RepID=UPI003695D12F